MATNTEKEFLIRVRADIRDAVRQLHNINNETRRTGDAASGAQHGVRGLGRGFDFLTRAAGAYLSLRMVTTVIRQADAFNVLQQRIKTATKETGDYRHVSDALLQTAQRNGVALRDTVALFQNLARTAPELHASNEEILTLVNAIQQLGVVGGSTQSQLSAGLLQFSQGLASGVFRAEEFNSIVENLPEVANRIAKGMGTTVGQLRRAVIQGKVLSQDVFDALIKQADDINQQFEGIDESLGRSSNSLSTAVTRVLGLINNEVGATNIFSRALGKVTERITALADRLDKNNLDAQERTLERLEKRLRNFPDFNGNPPIWAAAELESINTQIEETRANIRRLKVEFGGGGTAGKGAGLSIPITSDANKYQDDVNKIIDKLKQQSRELDLTKNEAALLDLNLLHASDSEIRFARSIVDAIDAHKKQQAVMEEGKKIYEETRTAQEKLAAQLAHLDELYAQGAFGKPGTAKAVDTYARAVFDAQDAVEGLGKTGKDTFDELVAAARGWGQEFSDTIANMVVEGKANFKDLADSIIKELVRILVYQTITKPVLQYFGVGVAHSGGIVGQSVGSSRQVSPAVFAGAQRYHTGGIAGLKPGEVPIIAQQGEAIIPRDQVGRASASGATRRVEVMNYGAPKQSTQVKERFDGKEYVTQIILDDIDRGGEISQGIESIKHLRRGR